MGIYASKIKAGVSEIRNAQLNNQIVLTGTDESFSVAKGVFFIEHIEPVSGTTVTISDGNGNQVATGVSLFSNDVSPLRCDYGVSISGNVAMLKGFFMDGIFQ